MKREQAMNRDEIMNKLVEILKKSDYYFLQNALENITEESKIIEELSMDSIQIMEFLVDIEEKFGLRFDFNEFDANSIESIGEIINIVMLHLPNKE